MTLITYPLRVHFADGVLEEALRSELDARGFSAPLILAEESDCESIVTDRIYAALPRRVRPAHVPIAPSTTKHAFAAEALARLGGQQPDVVIAYGSARAIEYARKCRHLLWTEALDAGEEHPLLDIFAVPGFDGLPNPCRAKPEQGQRPPSPTVRSGLPSIMICDPTVTLGIPREQSMAAAVNTLVRCLEAYLAEPYNPPADGMALDGFNRVMLNLYRILDDDDLDPRRELMAASLNAVLAQQKGIGPAQAMAEALRHVVGDPFQLGAASRLVLPGALATRQNAPEKIAALAQLMALERGQSLPDGLRSFLSRLPLFDSLSEMGITRRTLRDAAEELQESFGDVTRANPAEMLAILEAVY